MHQNGERINFLPLSCVMYWVSATRDEVSKNQIRYSCSKGHSKLRAHRILRTFLWFGCQPFIKVLNSHYFIHAYDNAAHMVHDNQNVIKPS